jgi:hypothetical protein
VLEGSAAQLFGAYTGTGLDWASSDRNVIDPWGGGFINTTGIYSGSTFIPGTFLCIWGGGHVDYSGNEMYCFGPLESDVPLWYCPRAATNPAPMDEEFDANGNPVSRHTYSSMCYLPTQNWMFAAGTNYRYEDSSGGGDTAVFQFNVASPETNQPWTQKANADTASGYAMGASTAAIYDPVHNIIWGNGNNQAVVGYYEVANDVWHAQIFQNGSWGDQPASAIDTKRGIWAIYGNGVLNFYEVNAGTFSCNSYYVPKTTGSGPTGTGGGSILYDAINDHFVVWNDSGTEFWTLTAPSSSPYYGGNDWTWSAVTPSGGATPTAQNTQGTYGRFNYIPNPTITGYILLNRVTDAIYFYRPA